MIEVTVRYFAAARAAAGIDEERITVAEGTSVAGLVVELGDRNPELARVLARCSYLRDGVAVRSVRGDHTGAGGLATDPLRTRETVDVLPPFAGG